MAINIGLAMAIGKGMHGVRKGIQSNKKKKDAGSPALVDPTQSAMVNLMHRERRAMATGTSDQAARQNLSRDTKTIQRRSILAGKRDLSDYTKFRAANEEAIIAGRANERLGMLKSINEETRNIADRKMDLIGLAEQKAETNSAAEKSSSGKNVMSQLPALQEALQKGANNDDAEGDGKKKNNGEVINQVGKAVKGIFSSMGNSGGGGGGGGEGGGMMGGMMGGGDGGGGGFKDFTAGEK